MNEARRKLIGRLYELEQHAAYIANTLFAEAGFDDHRHAAEMGDLVATTARIRAEVVEEQTQQQENEQ